MNNQEETKKPWVVGFIIRLGVIITLDVIIYGVYLLWHNLFSSWTFNEIYIDNILVFVSVSFLPIFGFFLPMILTAITGNIPESPDRPSPKFFEKDNRMTSFRNFRRNPYLSSAKEYKDTKNQMYFAIISFLIVPIILNIMLLLFPIHYDLVTERFRESFFIFYGLIILGFILLFVFYLYAIKNNNISLIFGTMFFLMFIGILSYTTPLMVMALIETTGFFNILGKFILLILLGILTVIVFIIAVVVLIGNGIIIKKLIHKIINSSVNTESDLSTKDMLDNIY